MALCAFENALFFLKWIKQRTTEANYRALPYLVSLDRCRAHKKDHV